MESFKIEDLSFSYPNREKQVLKNINLTIKQGEFITICGKSGCGKTTLLRLLKPSISPFGDLRGNIYFNNKPLFELDTKGQASQIGFVLQNPDNQIVTDKVWHELAFGLESLGYASSEIRTRVSEMASFFGIQTWFHKKVTELSGGQKQLLNLASVMVMQPSVLILDEPTSQLDPIASQEFLQTIEKINRELGTTIILTEHRLEDAFPISDRVVVMDDGKIIADSAPEKVVEILKNTKHDMYAALPTPVRVYGAVENNLGCPLTVRDGRVWLEEYAKNNEINPDLIPKAEDDIKGDAPIIELENVWFKYEKELPDVIKGMNLSVYKGKMLAIVGGNGTGKTTALSLMSGLNTPYRGRVLVKGENISKIHNLYNGILGVLPQNPQALFVKKTVYLDLLEILSENKLSKSEKEDRVKYISALCRIEELLDSHPYDLSGGEQQRAALAKVLLKNPEILLLDEPTKGMDAHFKEIFAEILKDLLSKGTAVIMVSHDIEFCAEYADECALMFDGNIVSKGESRNFFKGKNFYTTSANRMARTLLPDAVLAEDIILSCGGKIKEKKERNINEFNSFTNTHNTDSDIKEKRKINPIKITFGVIIAVLFIITCMIFPDFNNQYVQMLILAELFGCFSCFIPKKEFGTYIVQQPKSDRKLTKRTLVATILILIAIPFTIYIGMNYFGGRKYYLISILIILETFIPFCMVFENRKPEARELVVISVLCGIAVAGRTGFFMLPQFKPVTGLIIITGICFGGEVGFLVGAITGFVSNMFFGQGPWTPWQMFALGIIGFIAGILFRKGLLRKTKASICTFGAIITFFVYGGIMNPASVIMWQAKPNLEMIVSAYLMGITYDFIHALATAFFLWFISEPMIDKLERIKIKYGLIER